MGSPISVVLSELTMQNCEEIALATPHCMRAVILEEICGRYSYC